MSLSLGRGRCGSRPGAAARAGVLLTVMAGAVVLSPALPAAAAPAGAPPAVPMHGGLYSVWCPAASSCVAAGTRADGSVEGGSLIERWNGTRWSVTATPNPPSADSVVLHSVACDTGTYCMAVGEYIDRTTRDVRPAAEQWNGKAWSLTPVPFSARAALTNLDGVSCVTPTDCWAVGWSESKTLTDHWNGTTWSTEPSPSPQPGQLNTLDGVACPSATDCWAAGLTSHIYAPPGGYTRSLLEHWDGKSWSVAASPPGAVTLNGVSCAGGSACLAVGDTNGTIPAAQRWNGSRWLNLTPAEPSGSESWLNAVSCLGSAACEAVGGSTSGGLAESWNGAAWTVQEMPPSVALTPDGLSCTTAANCWSVGFVAVTTDSTTPGIEHWNGTRWSHVT
jgi:hypothetical protein